MDNKSKMTKLRKHTIISSCYRVQPGLTPETILRRRNRDNKAAEERSKSLIKKHREGKTNRDAGMKRAERFIKEYRLQQKSYTDIKKRVYLNSFFLSPSLRRLLSPNFLLTPRLSLSFALEGNQRFYDH